MAGEQNRRCNSDSCADPAASPSGLCEYHWTVDYFALRHVRRTKIKRQMQEWSESDAKRQEVSK